MSWTKIHYQVLTGGVDELGQPSGFLPDVFTIADQALNIRYSVIEGQGFESVKWNLSLKWSALDCLFITMLNVLGQIKFTMQYKSIKCARWET